MDFNELSVELTHKCHFNCIFCSSNSSLTPRIPDILDFNRLKEIVSECKSKFHINEISISGGEPFLYPDIFPLIEYTLDLGLKTSIYTTGLFLDQANTVIPWSQSFIDRIVNIQEKIDNQIIFVFDIQSMVSSTYEEITRKLGSFSQLLKTLNLVMKNPNIIKKSHLVPFQLNFSSILETVRVLFNMHFQEIRFLRFVPQGRASDYNSLTLNNAQFEQLQLLLLHLKKKFGSKIQLGHPIDFLFLFDKNEKIRACRGGFDGPLILPNGDVHLCPAWKNIESLSAGNINKSSFEDIWLGNYFQTIRSFIKDGYRNIKGLCEVCEYLSECKGKCTAQRILHFFDDYHLPDCLQYGPDPACPQILRNQYEGV